MYVLYQEFHGADVEAVHAHAHHLKASGAKKVQVLSNSEGILLVDSVWETLPEPETPHVRSLKYRAWVFEQLLVV